MIIKQGLINFFKNLKYIFTPLGTLFLGMLFGFSFLATGLKTQVNYATTEISAIVEKADISADHLKDCIVDCLADIPWSDPTEALKTLTSKDWLNNTLKARLEEEIENYAEYASEIESVVHKALKGFKKYFVGFAICAVLGFLAGIFLTKMIIRRSIAKRNLFKFLLISFVNSIITAGLTAICCWIVFLWKPSIFISSVLSIILYGLWSLFEAYLSHGYKKIALSQIVNVKNALSLLASNIIIYLMATAFCTAIYYITNGLVATFVILALLVIATIVISLNAEGYVKQVVADTESKNNSLATQTEPEIASAETDQK